MSKSTEMRSDLASLFDYYIYSNLIQTLFVKKQGTIRALPKQGAALLWGPSVFVGGAFTHENGSALLDVLKGYPRAIWLYVPDDEWRAFVKGVFSSRLKDRYLHVYRFEPEAFSPVGEESPCVWPVTPEMLQKQLPQTQLIQDELYSYTDLDDFAQNGFGVALVADGAVRGFCLSEYSLPDSQGVNIWIEEEYRGLGYARQMVNAFLARCSQNHQTAYWVCDAENERSNRIAAAAGFVLHNTMHYFEF